MRKVAVLLSGGVESSSLAVHYLLRGDYVYPFYVRSGLPWEEAERDHLLKLWTWLRKRYKRISPLRTLFMKGPSVKGVPIKEEQMEIPLRNMVLTVQTALLAHRRGIRTLGVGSLGVYPFPDNRREYFDRLEELISEGLRTPFKIDTPFMGMTKPEVIRRFSGKLRYDLTFSCANPVKGMHCGVCAKCVERKEGFKEAGVPDPTPYFS